MNGYRFYADLPGTGAEDAPDFGKRTTRAQLRTVASAGQQCNVIAVFTEMHGMQMGDFEGFVSVFGYPNSDVNVGGVDRGYLRQCRRIDEALARKLHPRLFARLDAE